MNGYFKNLNKIEFSVTMACTGKCRHCQNGDPVLSPEHIDPKAAEKSIRKICENYEIATLMTFGGEPLLFPDAVCSIHRTGKETGISRRQVITNGYFTKKHEKIEEVVRNMADSGVNDLLLSVDAFHQETIPLEPVMYFAECALRYNVPIRLSPAWLVSDQDSNPYNIKTREIIRKFEPLGITEGIGNVIFPSGNALKYLHEYFDENAVESLPYEEDPMDIRTISIAANGDVLDGNIYETDILGIMESYQPDHKEDHFQHPGADGR